MNTKRYTPALLPALFGLSLFSSQYDCVLSTPDSPNAGKGYFEIQSDNVVQAHIILHGVEFNGIGSWSASPLKSKNRALRGDRATLQEMTKSGPRRGHAYLSAQDKSELACEFSIDANQINGHCTNPASHLMLSIHSAEEK